MANTEIRITEVIFLDNPEKIERAQELYAKGVERAIKKGMRRKCKEAS
ncbi:hypothetical protein [Halonatronum saccharophilum]|nr:hypothetical protein [Halonatronum saccharophilum]